MCTMFCAPWFWSKPHMFQAPPAACRCAHELSTTRYPHEVRKSSAMVCHGPHSDCAGSMAACRSGRHRGSGARVQRLYAERKTDWWHTVLTAVRHHPGMGKENRCQGRNPVTQKPLRIGQGDQAGHCCPQDRLLCGIKPYQFLTTIW